MFKISLILRQNPVSFSYIEFDVLPNGWELQQTLNRKLQLSKMNLRFYYLQTKLT